MKHKLKLFASMTALSALAFASLSAIQPRDARAIFGISYLDPVSLGAGMILFSMGYSAGNGPTARFVLAFGVILMNNGGAPGLALDNEALKRLSPAQVELIADNMDDFNAALQRASQKMASENNFSRERAAEAVAKDMIPAVGEDAIAAFRLYAAALLKR
jgi:hypothetical protein